MGIYSDMSYHLLLSFEKRLNHGMEGSKFMVSIRWRGKVKVPIGSLAMYGGV